MNEVTRTSAVPGMRLETVKLIDALKTGKPGDTYTDEQLQQICDKDTRVTGDGYSYLGSAIRHCRNNHGVVWERVKGAGCIKCLNWEEVGESVDGDRRRIHRRAKVSCKKIATVDLAVVPEAGRVAFLAKAAHVGTLAAISDKGSQKKLEARKVTEPLDLKKLLEAMG